MFIHGVSANVSRIEGVFATISQEYPSEPIQPMQEVLPVRTETENSSMNNMLWQSPNFRPPMINQVNELVYQTDQARPATQQNTEKIGFGFDQSA